MSLGTEHHHILATDDDPGIRALLAELLDEEGYRVSLSSAQDVAEVAKLDPDLILLDYWDASVGAPSDFLDRLKAEVATAMIPFVVLTGARRQAEAQAARFAALGVTVVPKPFAIDDLLAEIRGRLGGTRNDANRDLQIDLRQWCGTTPQGASV
jgi:two-component system, NtrC family, nitrogen regulation response regulator NtrX